MLSANGPKELYSDLSSLEDTFDPDEFYVGDRVFVGYMRGDAIVVEVCLTDPAGDCQYLVEYTNIPYSSCVYSKEAMIPVEDTFIRYARWVKAKHGIL